MTSVTSAPGAATAAPLENTANNLARAGQSPDPRVARWGARGCLWHESSLERVRSCGRHSILPDGSVHPRLTATAVGYKGLASCGSVWACPVCNARIQARRRLEVSVALSSVLGAGGSAAFGAYTLRHRKGQSLDSIWRSLSKCWEAVTRDKRVRALRAAMGWVGCIRAAEVTEGANGWHPHLHPLHLFSRLVDVAEVMALHEAEFRAWHAAAARLGLSAPTEDAQHLHLVGGASAEDALGDYFTKASYMPTPLAVGFEMTHTQGKTSTRAKSSRTPFGILRAVYEDGDADALDLWHEYERASKGKRALTWTRGLRALVDLDSEATDEEIVAEVIGFDQDTRFLITDWSPVRAEPRLGAELLGVLKGSGWATALAYCREHGIDTRETN